MFVSFTDILMQLLLFIGNHFPAIYLLPVEYNLVKMLSLTIKFIFELNVKINDKYFLLFDIYDKRSDFFFKRKHIYSLYFIFTLIGLY